MTNSEIEIQAILSRLSYQDKERILRNLIVDVFGDVDDEGEDIINPHYQHDKYAIKPVADALRAEFWPGLDDSQTD